MSRSWKVDFIIFVVTLYITYSTAQIKEVIVDGTFSAEVEMHTEGAFIALAGKLNSIKH